MQFPPHAGDWIQGLIHVIKCSTTKLHTQHKCDVFFPNICDLQFVEYMNAELMGIVDQLYIHMIQYYAVIIDLKK
jgi:hypothetical protein